MRWELCRPEKGDLDVELAVAVLGLAMILGVVALRLLPERYHPTRPCTFHALTGRPCLTCGGTRAAKALGRFEFREALTRNPLAALWLLLAIPHAAWVFLARLRGWPRPRLRAESRRDKWLIAGAVIALLTANWGYLIAVGA